MRAVYLVVFLALSGCAIDTDSGTTKEAVAEEPCDRSKLPRPPILAADALTGDEDLFVIGTTLWADRKARQAYERELATFADGCSKR